MSDPRIGPTSTSFPQPLTDHQPIEKPKAGPVCSVEQNRIEQAERHYATSTMSPFESTISNAASRLGPHQSFEVSCKALVSAEVAAKVEGKISIERRDDGKYEVAAFAGGQVGGGDAHSRAMAGVAGGTKFVVDTPEAAADIAQAIATVGGVASAVTSPALFPWAILADKATGASAHALARLDHYRANLVEVKGDARATAALSVELPKTPGVHGHAAAELQGAGGVKIDFERGEISAAFRVDVSGEVKAGLGLGHGALASSASMMAFEGELEGKFQGRLEARKHVPPAMAEKLKRGEMTSSEAWEAMKNAKTEWVFVGEAEAEKSLTGMTANGVGKLKVTTEIPISGEALAKQILSGDQAALLRPLIDAEWEVEAEIGWGGRVGGATDGFLAEATATVFTKAKSEKGSLAHCLEHGDRQIAEHVQMKKSLEAQGIH